LRSKIQYAEPCNSPPKEQVRLLIAWLMARLMARLIAKLKAKLKAKANN